MNPRGLTPFTDPIYTPPVLPAYDADGNYQHGPLPVDYVQDHNATLLWDAENRLIQVTRHDNTEVTYAYDHLSRRISKTVTPALGTAVTTRYLYDGWNIIAEYAGTALERTYLWGMDLSGTMQGAGGVGGLLSVSKHTGTVQNPVRTPFYPTYDGNGNISEYLNESGAAVAHYEYDAFGNTVVNTDTVGQFAYRFSTKPLDAETGLYYYGYRYYNPVTGRWPSRDPIEERGGVNLYSFTNNSPPGSIDNVGLSVYVFSESKISKYDSNEFNLDWDMVKKVNKDIEKQRIKVKARLKLARENGDINDSTFAWFDHKGKEEELGKGEAAATIFEKRMDDENVKEESVAGKSLLGDMEQIGNAGGYYVKYDYDVVVYAKHGNPTNHDVMYGDINVYKFHKLQEVARNFEYVVQELGAGEGVLVICSKNGGRSVVVRWPASSIFNEVSADRKISKCRFEFYAASAEAITH